MASKYWIKLYHEILDDPKMGRLSDTNFRRAIELFLLAGEADMDGEIPPVEDIAWRLRIPVEELSESLNALQDVGIVFNSNGVWIVTKFADRQGQMSDAERKRRVRTEKQKDEYYDQFMSETCPENVRKMSGKCPENVRNSDADIDKIRIDVDTDKEAEAEAEKKPTTDLVFSRYESNFGPLTPLTAEKLKDMETVYPEGWIIEAMKLSVERNARNLSYVEAILKRWQSEGKDSGKKSKPKAKPVEQRTADDYRKAWSNL